MLAATVTTRLLAQPETGMGWQIVEIAQDHWIEHALVVNAESLLESNPGEARLLREGAPVVRRMRVALILEVGSPGTEFRALSRSEARGKGLIAERMYVAGPGPASDAVLEASRVDERFLRFSAFANCGFR